MGLSPDKLCPYFPPPQHQPPTWYQSLYPYRAEATLNPEPHFSRCDEFWRFKDDWLHSLLCDFIVKLTPLVIAMTLRWREDDDTPLDTHPRDPESYGPWCQQSRCRSWWRPGTRTPAGSGACSCGPQWWWPWRRRRGAPTGGRSSRRPWPGRSSDCWSLRTSSPSVQWVSSEIRMMV